MEKHLTNEVLDKVFFVDGSLRDIYVLDVNLDDWQKLIDWLCLSDWGIEFYIDGQKNTNKITNVSKLFEEKKDKSVLLSIDIKGVLINCHFFVEGELEFDLNPKEIKGLNEARSVFEFMSKLSNILGKEIILTEEDILENPLVTVKSDGTLLIDI
ncbi:hypothetical protein CN514_22765 [Bacillus sp. AFS001701]|uniref:hypothetical protein n=1 Tax=Bacillus sp. AFS001701 TaxID=2033480 RepID=UPI000BF8BB39|nr:hypothetical protein [Bacillus sp. AFS001701]PET42346.1 hypothetical protein CN514_22765 [Bacillus sp. AFS001701]